MVHSNIKTMEFPKFWEGKKKNFFKKIILGGLSQNSKQIFFWDLATKSLAHCANLQPLCMMCEHIHRGALLLYYYFSSQFSSQP